MNFFGGIKDDEVPPDVLKAAQELSNDPELIGFVKAALPAALLRYQGEISAESSHIVGKDALFAAFATLTLVRANIRGVNEVVQKVKAKNEN